MGRVAEKAGFKNNLKKESETRGGVGLTLAVPSHDPERSRGDAPATVGTVKERETTPWAWPESWRTIVPSPLYTRTFYEYIDTHNVKARSHKRPKRVEKTNQVVLTSADETTRGAVFQQSRRQSDKSENGVRMIEDLGHRANFHIVLASWFVLTKVAGLVLHRSLIGSASISRVA